MSQVHRSRLDQPSMCDGWTIRQVLNHSLGVTHKFADFASGVTDEPHSPTHDMVGHDHRTSTGNTIRQAKVAWAMVDLTRRCNLPFGTFSAEAAAGINLFDTLAHTWDIAAPLAIPLEPEDRLWTVGLHAARAVIEPSRDLNHYKPEVLISPNAPAMHRFLAWLGRSVPAGT